MSLSLVLFRSSAYSNTAYESDFHATPLQSSTLLMLVDAIDKVSETVPCGQAILNEAHRLSPVAQQVSGYIDYVAEVKQAHLANVLETFKDAADAESVGASAQTAVDIEAARNSAEQMYRDGVEALSESVETAKELLEDEANDG